MDVSNLPVIAGVVITTDEQGRFNLNALHKASNLGSAKQPSNWLRLESTQALVDELDNSSDVMSSPIVTAGGRNGGTFAHELLAVSYAGWISPSFQLQVNQIFLDFKTGRQPAFDPSQLSRMDILSLAMEAEKEKQAAQEEVQRLNQVCNTITRQFIPGETAPRFCMQFNGVNTQQVQTWLTSRGHLINEGKKGFRPSAVTRDLYFKLHTIEDDRGKERYQAQLTLKGAKWLYKKYLDGQLPMKKSWDGRFSHVVFADPVFVPAEQVAS